MRILALRPKGLVLPSIHASMVKAFQSLGVEVLDFPLPQEEKDYRNLKKVCRRGYDALFILDLGGDRNLILNFKELQLTIRIPWIVWFVDDPDGYRFPEAFAPEWTLIFCWDQAIAQKDFFWNGRPVTYLPLATDPSIFYQEKGNYDLFYSGGVFAGSTVHPNSFLVEVVKSAPGMEEDGRSIWLTYRDNFNQPLHELAWARLAQKGQFDIQTLRKDPLGLLWVKALVYQTGIVKRKEVVAKVIKSGGGVFGDEGWAKAVDKSLYQGRVKYGEELRKIYNRSSFALEVRQPQSRTGLSQRVFDASACRCPVIAEWSPELPNLFDSEREIIVFRNWAEVEESKERFKANYKDVQEKAEKARQRVLASHTYFHRADKILKIFHDYF